MMDSKFPVIDIESLRAWIGREDVAEDVVTPELVRRYTATVGLPVVAPRVGEPAPVMIHHCLAPPAAAMGDLGADGHPARGLFLPPVPLPRRMWAGGELRIHGAFRVGDTVRRVSRIGDVVLKEGRSGRLCFVTLEHRYEAGGVVKLEERQDVVYRDHDAGRASASSPGRQEKSGGEGVATSPPAAPAGEQRRSVDAYATMLFRYSALTFNGHRIHYDRKYTVGTEGYPGLVVHGPLQATLLVLLAAELKGKTPAAFSFRSLSPLFDLAPTELHASADGAGLALWTCRPGGPVAMQATASWA